MWSLPDIKKKNKVEPLFSCFHCGKMITSEESYFEIYHYIHMKNGPRKQFHESCFEEVAGKVYTS